MAWQQPAVDFQRHHAFTSRNAFGHAAFFSMRTPSKLEVELTWTEEALKGT